MDKRVLDLLKYLLGMIFNAAVFIFVAMMIYSYTQKSFAFGKDFAAAITAERAPREVEIVLRDDATIDEVADILYENGVISNALVFKLESVLKNTDSDFEGGTFLVNAAMDSIELMGALRSRAVATQDVRVTILEGYTTRDIGALLENSELVSAEEFSEACNKSSFNYSFLDGLPKRENRLEGYLFPDTYFFAEDSDPEDIIVRLLNRFDEIYKWEYYERARELGLTMDEVIIIASIIEKEIRVPEERALASAVIYNRLERGEALGMCSTILYALDKRKDRLLDEDLQVESSYNTYIYPGLPEGPISNPGEACIIAALYPADVDYLWFVVKDEETGEHFFTNSYDEFLNAKVLYQQKF